jgi:hypothetical protein
MPAGGLAISAGLGLYQVAKGLIGESKAAKEEKIAKANRPILKPGKEFGENVSLAESELTQGMSAKAQKAYQYATDKATGSSLSAILKGGGNVNNIGDLYGANEEGRMRLSSMQDALRLSQIQSVVSARSAKAQEDQTAWQVNEYAPYKDELQAIAKEKQGAADSVSRGINQIGAAGMQFAGAKSEDNLYSKYFSTTDQAAPKTTNTTGFTPETITSESLAQPSYNYIH